jgi:hypothetical protein
MTGMGIVGFHSGETFKLGVSSVKQGSPEAKEFDKIR